MVFKAFIGSSPNNLVLLDGRVGEKLVALNENIFAAGRE